MKEDQLKYSCTHIVFSGSKEEAKTHVFFIKLFKSDILMPW